MVGEPTRLSDRARAALYRALRFRAPLEAGLDAKDVSILMGHSSTRITQDIYQHVSPSRARDAAERIGGALFGRSEGA